MFNADYAEMYAEMKVGSFVRIDHTFEANLGDVTKTFFKGDMCEIVGEHNDNADLEPGHKLYRVKFLRSAAHYEFWFRAHKLGLDA